MNALDIVKRADGPAIATDKKSRVLGWNQPARDLFEHADGRNVVGKPLHSALDVRDSSGNRIDFSQMPLHQMVTRGEPVHGFEIEARKKSGDSIRLLVSVVVVLGPRKSTWEVVYLLRPIFRRRKADEVIERVLANPANGRNALDRSANSEDKKRPDLTRRQADVLRLLAQGLSNEEIATSLFLSVYTVRSHVQSILEKLGVHSKVEAVSRAFRDGLI
jgi:DNA-binding CsgD family transcriptional regulator